ncbi:Uu.00g121860.m01.CDS01 [Anthostomella pinea]|uniref:Uu.00g121860.m01.CDS01 n=1 Tax=Anthostomella pinea TaxID=933095 RepID=A0AAI8VBU9_9PEZI|nr:Uu.00g121860.m01.CDS01 [Anthostomella pinea]
MAQRRASSFGQSLAIPTSNLAQSRSIETIELSSVPTSNDPYSIQVHRRRNNARAVIENPLAHLTDEELERDVRHFSQICLPSVGSEKLLRAARVAKDVRSYDDVARSEDPTAGLNLPVQLTPEEKSALKAERDELFSQRNMIPVILTVSLAAFLQGFVQSLINGASLFASEFGLPNVTAAHTGMHDRNFSPRRPTGDDWRLGAANASPYLFAAFVGCWVSLPINDRVGRRGAMAVAACLIFASSLGAVWCDKWYKLFIVRFFNGVGMGVKAVSTPILASETAIGYWRGSSILAWQLWVAFGIMMGFAFNLIFYTANNHKLSLQLILGAPMVPCIFLLVGLWFCPESPRYYMRRRSRSFNPSKAYHVLLKLRKTELQALRDIYLVYKSVQQEYTGEFDFANQGDYVPRGLLAHMRLYVSRTSFSLQLCLYELKLTPQPSCDTNVSIVNIFAFYSGPLFNGVLQKNDALHPMLYSLGYGAVNFVFGLPAIRTIDTLGRRKWLVLTLPAMCLFMAAAALSSLLGDPQIRGGIIALFVFLFAAAYSPGMGPIPFTLASESFPLSHREIGCAFAIAVNLLFAGILSISFPSIYAALKDGGTFGIFSGLNFLAFILVLLLVEETKRRSLEDLDLVFAVRKTVFIKHQVTKYVPWFVGHYLLRRKVDKPSLYEDLVWGTPKKQSKDGEDVEEGRSSWQENVLSADAPQSRPQQGLGAGPEPRGRASEESEDSRYE